MDIEERVARLEKEIAAVHERNRKVEADKAWETSKVRIGFLVCLIYIVAAIALGLMQVQNYLLNALVPALGYFLSVQSVPIVKRWWLRKFLVRRR